MTGLIFDLKKFSLHDGPGIRTTVFFKGCPLQCWWCHNPEGIRPEQELLLRPNCCIRCGACVEACPQGALSAGGEAPRAGEGFCTQCGACVEACYAGARELVGRWMAASEVLAEIECDAVFYDESGGGVTVSGGEPLLQPDFLRALLRGCRDRGMHTALDTCGYAPWEVLDGIREWVDLFLYDLKLLDDARHRQYTGVSNALILENLRALAERGQRIWLRVPVIPGINDGDRDVRRLGAFAAGLPHLERVDLLPYHPLARQKYSRLGFAYALPDVRAPSAERLEQIRDALAAFGLPVHKDT